jgi:hypothetical protein
MIAWLLTVWRRASLRGAWGHVRWLVYLQCVGRLP